MNGKIQTKQRLRNQLRNLRRSLTCHQQRLAADNLCSILSTHPLFKYSRSIAFYQANDGEIDPSLLLTTAQRHGKSCYLPCLQPTFRSSSQNRLWFAQVHIKSTLSPNRYGIPEPDHRLARMIHPAALQLVLLPLVGFDQAGHRLGMGKGYYDQTFSFLRTRQPWRRPILLGLAHECQKIDELPADGWDIPLHGIVTDRRWYDCTLEPRGRRNGST